MKPAEQRHLAWVFVAVVVLAALVWACSGSGDANVTDPGTSGGTSSSGASGAGASSGTSGTSSSSGDGTSGGATPDGGDDDAGPIGPGTIPTEASFKVAFVGDTGKGNDFKSVLQLVKRENADLLLVQGDLNYSNADIITGLAGPWFETIDGELQAGAQKIPYFASKGNHDVLGWGGNNGYGNGLKTRMTGWGITSENGDPTTTNYSVVYKGLKMVFVDESETSPKRADYVKARLANDDHIWKICSWHKNMRNSNVGPKNDEMGWEIYENCRAAGAIIAQGHSHTYSRSKTLTNATTQIVDTTCSDPFELCVAPGKTFFFDSSVGGEDTRSVENNIAAKPHFATNYTGNFGALFIEFNVDGDARKAKGYFKTVNDTIVDPPASSGKTFFTITRQ